MAKQLSIVAELDDLMRMHYALTAPVETDFILYVEETQRKQREMTERHNTELAEKENALRDMHHVARNLENEKKGLEQKLLHSQHETAAELERRKEVERKLELFRELAVSDNQTTDRFARQRMYAVPECDDDSRLSTESASLLLDYTTDKTQDLDLNASFTRSGKSYKRPSAPPEPSPPAKRKTHHEQVIATSTTTADMRTGQISVDTEVHPHVSRGVSIYPKLATIPDSPTSGISQMLPKTPIDKFKLKSGGTSLNHQHEFVHKSMLKLAHCSACGKKCKFGKPIVNCQTCGMICHEECARSASVPCFPLTPKHLQMEGKLRHFCSEDPPYVPGLVIHCVGEIERRGFAPGIYRESGSHKEIRELKDKFLQSKGAPHLSDFDIHTLAGCIKLFFRELKEELVPSNRFREFSSVHDHLGLQDLVESLPEANRDTLAFFMLHLLRVAQSVRSKMDDDNLAKVFAPTLVGTAQEGVSYNSNDVSREIIVRLLDLPVEFWNKFITGESASDDGATPMRNHDSPLLGPVKSGGKRRRSKRHARSKTGYTTPVKASTSQRKFFQSPMLI